MCVPRVSRGAGGTAVTRSAPYLLVALDVHQLPERVPDLDEVARVGHDDVDVLVGGRYLVEEGVAVPPLDAPHRLLQLGAGEGLARPRPREHPAGAMRRGLQRLGVAEAADDVARRPHRAGDEPVLPSPRLDGALAGDPEVLAEVPLPLGEVVVAIYALELGRPVGPHVG